MYSVPNNIKLYHIAHWDRIPSIVEDGCLLNYATVQARQRAGTDIGYSTIKARRITTPVPNSGGLNVGNCVPFYFCPRSVMLYVLHKGDAPGLEYREGQAAIVHLVLDLSTTVQWCDANDKRWAFTLSNAGSSFFEARADLADLGDINWDAVHSRDWAAPDVKEGKQAEFLAEDRVPWELVESIGVYNTDASAHVARAIALGQHKPHVTKQPTWYY